LLQCITNYPRLRTCFEEDPHGEITQLALWSAYNAAFKGKETRPLMQAKDFITNVSTTFASAQAQVVANEEDPSRPKYTIRGVRARAVPVNKRGEPYMRCLWVLPSPATNGFSSAYNGQQSAKGTECDMSVAKAEEMWEHIASVHLGVAKDTEAGRFKIEDAETDSGTLYSCRWGGCKNPAAQNQSNINVVAKHIQTHLPSDTLLYSHRIYNTSTPAAPNPLSGKGFLNTATDERQDAAGLPLASVLVLRNLARQMGKVDAKFVAEAGRTTKERIGWVEKAFAPVRERLFYVMAWNNSLRDYMPTLEGLVDKGIGLSSTNAIASADVEMA
jgi:chromatin structure-remodeling complex subunit RSC9